MVIQYCAILTNVYTYEEMEETPQREREGKRGRK